MKGEPERGFGSFRGIPEIIFKLTSKLKLKERFLNTKWHYNYLTDKEKMKLLSSKTFSILLINTITLNK